MCIRVKVVVSGGHLLRAEELGHLAPAGAAGQAGGVGRVRRQRRPSSMLDGRHRLGQRGGLCRLGWNYTNWLRLWLLGGEGRRRRKKKPEDSGILEGSLKNLASTEPHLQPSMHSDRLRLMNLVFRCLHRSYETLVS